MRVIPKTYEAKQNIKNAISKNILFKHLDDEQMEKVVDVMFEKKITSGEVIMKQGNCNRATHISIGDDGDNFYVIDKGEQEIIKDGKLVATIGPGRFFGELALMYNVPRMATVRVPTACVHYNHLQGKNRGTMLGNGSCCLPHHSNGR